ncbi:MAG: CapA family protein [Deltaproteobacteria bacterium]|nr:MAG: CapA family protein [Deltaproteobacteria bacterium]
MRNFILFLSLILLYPLESWASGSETEKIMIRAVGDIMMAGSMEEFVKEKGYDYPFSETRQILQRSDICFANLESPLTEEGTRVLDKQFTFKMPPKSLDALIHAGFNLFSLANNHILDYGEEGLKSTLQLLRSNKINFAGAGENLKEARQPAIFEVRGIKIGFLAYSLTFPESFYASSNKPGTAFGHLKFLKKDIKSLRKKVDLIIVSFHWGGALMKYPKDYQIELAHQAVRSGADLVFGHHPHVVQGIERYQKGIIFYSLGNFVFGSYSHNARRSIIAGITWGRRGVEQIEIVPINVFNAEVLFNPRILSGKEAEETIAELNLISQSFNTKIIYQEGNGLIELK